MRTCGSSLWLLVLFFGFAQPGCMSRPAIDETDTFTTGVQQNDIPVPLNFRFDPNRGYDYRNYRTGVGSFRSWRGFYYGDHQVASLIPWYQQQMTVDGWTYRDTKDDDGIRCLRFQKEEEMASIWLYRDYDQRLDRYVTIVRAEIHPTPIEELSHEEAIQLTSGSVRAAPASAVAVPARASARQLPRAGREPRRLDPAAKGLNEETANDSAPAIETEDAPAPRDAVTPSRAPSAAPRGSSAIPPATGRSPQPPSVKAPAAVAAGKAGSSAESAPPLSGNKAVVNEEMGAENSHESRQEEEIAPEDGE